MKSQAGTVTRKTKAKTSERPIRLKTWDDVNAYFKKHLKPIAYGPKGQPMYRHADIEKLNIRYPDDPA